MCLPHPFMLGSLPHSRPSLHTHTHAHTRTRMEHLVEARILVVELQHHLLHLSDLKPMLFVELQAIEPAVVCVQYAPGVARATEDVACATECERTQQVRVERRGRDVRVERRHGLGQDTCDGVDEEDLFRMCIQAKDIVYGCGHA